MTEVTKGDLMFFQNEILGDIKKLEQKINNKIESSIEELKIKVNDLRNTNLYERYENITSMLHSNHEKSEQVDKLLKFKTKIEEFAGKLNNKTDKLEKELEDSTNKFDKILNYNLTLPGIIGNEKCKYKNLRDFLDYINKTIHTLSTNKDKNNIDLKGYKEKLETNIKSFGLQIDHVTNKFKEFCNKSIKFCEEQFTKRIEETEEKVQTLRIENSKYTLELLNECENLKVKQKELDEYKERLENRYSDHYRYQESLYHELTEQFEENQKEFKLIKQKFTELSDFIKNVRFRKNIGDTIKIQEFRDMSRKIDFMRKQNLNDFEIEVPDFIMENENEVIRNYIKKNNNNEDAKKKFD